MTTAARDGVGLAAAWRLLSLGLAPPTEETLAEVESLAEALMEVDGSPEIAELRIEPPGKREPAYIRCQSASMSRGSRPTSHCRAPSPVSASMRRTPDDTALSDTIRKTPMSPSALTWVPPHNSTE
jgi:hypothetical protein